MTEQTPTDRVAHKTADRLWLIERAAERLDAARTNGHAAPKPTLAERAEAAAQRPTDPAVDGQRDAASNQQMSPRKSQTVTLDFAWLQAKGYLTPATMTSALAEQMRMVKRSLLHRFRKGTRARSNVILVTSSQPGEGKSFISLNLAMSLACEYDLRVVLIDGDFGRPDLLTRMGVHEQAGLLDIVADPSRDLSEVLLRTDLERLSLIPSGQNRELASELVGSQRMGQIVDELSTRYPDRLVIIDSAPVLADSGTAILSEYAGQVVFVVEADRTDRATIDDALEQMPADLEPQIVLNKNRGRGRVRTPYYKYAAP
ncbi:AAA family ATPase [Rhodovibrio salinarum]|nr:AAA family ATPase [Rhodovibrio salinarum]